MGRLGQPLASEGGCKRPEETLGERTSESYSTMTHPTNALLSSLRLDPDAGRKEERKRRRSALRYECSVVAVL